MRCIPECIALANAPAVSFRREADNASVLTQNYTQSALACALFAQRTSCPLRLVREESRTSFHVGGFN